MPIKLNKCKECGKKPTTLYESYSNGNSGRQTYYTIICVKCAKHITKFCKEAAYGAWNAANPQEVPHEQS